MSSKRAGQVFLWMFFAWAACAHAAEAPRQAQPIDWIMAVVNDDVITRHELDVRLAVVVNQLKKQGTPLPEAAVLEKQILERMIGDMLQLQFAKETGLRVDDAMLDKALGRIAQQNKLPSLAAFRAKVEQEGVDFNKFREEIRTEILTTRLREREVDSKLVVSENEIENYLANQSKQAGKGEELKLAHIMVVVPEQASAEKIGTYKQRAEEALAKLRGGAPFAQVAAGYSDAADALQGGNLGWRPADRLPSMFAEALQKLQPGEVSEILRSPNGFHILKLVERRSKDAPVVITQTHARHILIKTSELVPENEAKSRLAEIKQRIDKGADFAEQAKLYSEDGSATQGGDLGWLSPGETVPEFEGPMDALKVGQISGLVQSGFGWHLIQVLERRNTDVSVEQKKQQARNSIRAFRSDEAFQDWLRQLRDRAFVEYRK
ncbi:MAG: molecular chaperone SurA [Gallionellaceae bacterium]|nr:MAG: molecular chaperone SurA [Gallionellaceae bacterium]